VTNSFLYRLQVGVPGVEVFPHHLGLITYGNIHLIDSADEDLVAHLPGAITWLDGCLHSGGSSCRRSCDTSSSCCMLAH
jgi:hypothetical protein